MVYDKHKYNKRKIKNMACASCTNKYNSGYIHDTALSFPPYNSADIQVYQNGEIKQLESSDWSTHRHKLLLFYPETNTPVCATEMGAINDWIEPFNELDCDVFSVTADPIEMVKEWYETNELLIGSNYKALSSYILPSRLGLIHNNRSKRASVFITKDGDVVIQEHFMKVGRSLAELHRMLYGYTTDSYCAEGWHGPEDGFVS
jgi:alkyl hydroperoxide reductase subunit AhpC